MNEFRHERIADLSEDNARLRNELVLSRAEALSLDRQRVEAREELRSAHDEIEGLRLRLVQRDDEIAELRNDIERTRHVIESARLVIMPELSGEPFVSAIEVLEKAISALDGEEDLSEPHADARLDEIVRKASASAVLELEEARRALGKGWLAGGVSLAEGIRRKCASLETLHAKGADNA